jgi:hypothetical protein
MVDGAFIVESTGEDITLALGLIQLKSEIVAPAMSV